MPEDIIAALIARVDQERLRRTVFHLSKDPLPYRKLNYTRPGQNKSTLHEADDFIEGQLRTFGYDVAREGVRVQAFRCDRSKPRHHWYSPPDPDDPWYTAYNLYAKKRGGVLPDEIIVLVSHKDSPSWIDSPGAYDNAVGTAGTLEMARVLADYPSRRSMWFLFCNEEHWPWTSVTAAEGARARADNIVAVYNVDGIGSKPQADIDAGRRTNATYYTTPEGLPLAELMAEVNETYRIGLVQSIARKEQPGDDEGSFIKAGYLVAAANHGSTGTYPDYHEPGDIPERVDMPNVRMAVQATLAAVLRLDQAD